MTQQPEGLISANVPAASPEEPDALHALAARVALQPTLSGAARTLSSGLARLVNVPVAGLTSKRYAATLRQAIDPERARPSETMSDAGGLRASVMVTPFAFARVANSASSPR